MDSVIKIWTLESSTGGINYRISSNNRCSNHEFVEVGLRRGRHRHLWVIRPYLILQRRNWGTNKEAGGWLNFLHFHDCV